MDFNTKNLIFYLKKSNTSTIPLCFLSYSRAEEPANFLVAPAPDFFPSGSGYGFGSCFFSRGSGSGSKEPETPGSGSPALEKRGLCIEICLALLNNWNW